MTATVRYTSPVKAAMSRRAVDISGPSSSSFRTLLEAAAKRSDVVTLGRGEPDIPTPAHIIEAAKRALDEGRTTYSNPAGLPQLRAAIAQKLGRENGVPYDADEVIVTAGAQEAIAVSMQTLLEPGDEVLLAAPYYGGYLTNITLAGGVPIPVPTFESEGFELDPDRLEAMITKRSKVVALVSPSNPTGSMLSRDALLRIAEIVERHDLVVVSDELYEKNVYVDEPAISFASLPGMRDRTITINGFSKAHSMTGFRVGYMAAPRDFCEAAFEVRHAISIASPTPSQFAALAALEGPQDHIVAMRTEYIARQAVMGPALSKLGVTFAQPKGAFFFFGNVSQLPMSAFEFSLAAVERFGVLFFPGTMYGKQGEGYARISFLAPIPILETALERFGEAYRWAIDAG